MSVLVNPATGMVPVYPFYLAQDYYYRMLVALRDVQNTITPEFNYKVTKNKSETYIVEETDQGLVNVMIGPVDSEQASVHSKEHAVKLIFELYWKSKDDSVSGENADELAINYLYYLAANVEFGLTAIYNQVPDNITKGDFQIKQLRTNFSKPEKVGESDSVWGLGQIELDIRTAYTYDAAALVNLNTLTTDIGNGLAQTFNPNP